MSRRIDQRVRRSRWAGLVLAAGPAALAGAGVVQYQCINNLGTIETGKPAAIPIDTSSSPGTYNFLRVRFNWRSADPVSFTNVWSSGAFWALSNESLVGPLTPNAGIYADYGQAGASRADTLTRTMVWTGSTGIGFSGLPNLSPYVAGTPLFFNYDQRAGGASGAPAIWENIEVSFRARDFAPPIETTHIGLAGTRDFNITAGDAAFVSFDTDGLNDVVIDTLGSNLTGAISASGDNDTELAVYRADGTIVRLADNISGSNRLTRTTFTAGTLAPGRYYVGLSATEFLGVASTVWVNGFGWDVSSAQQGLLRVNITQIPAPHAAGLLLGGLTAMGVRRRRARA